MRKDDSSDAERPLDRTAGSVALQAAREIIANANAGEGDTNADVMGAHDREGITIARAYIKAVEALEEIGWAYYATKDAPKRLDQCVDLAKSVLGQPWEHCSDCPPAGYPTDATRCLACPRRAAPSPDGEGDGREV